MENLSRSVLEQGLASCLGRVVGQNWTTLKVQPLCRVERVTLANDRSIILKVVRPPLQREGIHYRQVVPALKIPAPRLLGEAEVGTLTFLAFEDLAAPPLTKAPTVDKYEAAARLLAELRLSSTLHADQLNLPILALADVSREVQQATNTLVTGYWPGLEAALVAQLRDLNANYRRLAAKVVNQPLALVHGNFNGDSLMFARGNIYVIDWSHPHVAPHLSDLDDLLSDARQRQLAPERILHAYVGALGDPLATRRLPTLLKVGAIVRHCRWINWFRRCQEQYPETDYHRSALKRAGLIGEAWQALKADERRP